MIQIDIFSVISLFATRNAFSLNITNWHARFHTL